MWVFQRLEGHHTYTAAGSIHLLADHDEARHMNDLELDPKLEHQHPDFSDQLIEAGAPAGAQCPNPIGGTVVRKVKDGHTLYFPFLGMAYPFLRALEGVKLFPVQGEVIDHQDPLAFPHLERAVRQKKSAPCAHPATISSHRNEGGRRGGAGIPLTSVVHKNDEVSH
jgi:hypothetical protein